MSDYVTSVSAGNKMSDSQSKAPYQVWQIQGEDITPQQEPEQREARTSQRRRSLGCHLSPRKKPASKLGFLRNAR